MPDLENIRPKFTFETWLLVLTWGPLYYLTGGGIIPSIDTIDYDPRYAKAVKEFECFYHVLVYHAIETESRYGRLLSMLYVGKTEDSWAQERLNDDELMAYVVNLDDEDVDEFGYIQVMCANGALIRIA